ncbi:MAG: ABC transporter ATP-binding protein [Chloroflexi bacterium]|nr:ABC transporter ATP-binding protein [Chloroflexota bacterium]
MPRRPTRRAVFERALSRLGNPETKSMHAQIGYMTQQFTLFQDLTAAENIQFYGQVYGLSRAELRHWLHEILRMVGLERRQDALTSTLSAGWKQRLALGCAIVHRPRVLFLDEPTAGVDPVSRRQFWDLMYAMVDDGVTVLVTTHYMDEAELCHRIAFISQGRLVALDTPAHLKETQMRGQVLEISAADPDSALRALRRAQASGAIPLDEVALYGAEVHAVVPNAERYAPACGICSCESTWTSAASIGFRPAWKTCSFLR